MAGVPYPKRVHALRCHRLPAATANYTTRHANAKASTCMVLTQSAVMVLKRYTAVTATHHQVPVQMHPLIRYLTANCFCTIVQYIHIQEPTHVGRRLIQAAVIDKNILWHVISILHNWKYTAHMRSLAHRNAFIPNAQTPCRLSAFCYVRLPSYLASCFSSSALRWRISEIHTIPRILRTVSQSAVDGAAGGDTMHAFTPLGINPQNFMPNTPYHNARDNLLRHCLPDSPAGTEHKLRTSTA